jgi:hypothetical protein
MFWPLLFATFTASAQCCYNPEPVDLFETPHKKYNFEFHFKEPNRDFEIFILLNILDGYTTYRGLKNPNVTELNRILGNNPSPGKLIAVKAFGTWYTYKYVPQSDLKILNKALFYLVVNNVEVLDKVEETYHE